MSEGGSTISTPDLTFASDPPPTVGYVVTCASGSGMAALAPGVAPSGDDDGAYATDAAGVQITSNLTDAVGSAIYPAGLGANSVIAGRQSTCSGQDSICVGYFSSTPVQDSIILGSETQSQLCCTYGASNYAASSQGLVVGTQNNVSTPGLSVGTVCVGDHNEVDADTEIVMGSNIEDHSVGCVVVGQDLLLTADLSYSVVMGTDHQLGATQGDSIVCAGRNVELVNTCTQTTALGVNITANTCERSVFVGSECSGTNANQSVVVGTNNQSSANDGVAIGNDCIVDAGGVCIGRDITNSGNPHVAVGRNIVTTGATPTTMNVCIGSDITDSGNGNVIIGHGITNARDGVTLLTARNNGGYTQLSATSVGVHCGGAPGTQSGFMSYVAGQSTLTTNTSAAAANLLSLRSNSMGGKLTNTVTTAGSVVFTLPTVTALRTGYNDLKIGDTWCFLTVVGLGSPAPTDYTVTGGTLFNYLKWSVNLNTGWVDGGPGTPTRQVMRNTSCKWKITSNSSVTAGPVELLRLTPQTAPFVYTDGTGILAGTLAEADGSTVTVVLAVDGSVLATAVCIGGVVNAPSIIVPGGRYYFISRAPGKSDCILGMVTSDV